MRYLENFVNYLNESAEDITDLSKEELDELLIPITDLGIEYSLTEPRTITEGEFSGFKSMNIQFRNTFKVGPSGGYTEQIIDDKFWDFLDELIALKNRLESSKVTINTNWKHHIVVTFVQKSKVEGDLFLVQQLYNEMTKRTSASKSDFTNNMTKKIDKENLKITVNCNGAWDTASQLINPSTSGTYTDRKWNGLFRGIDFSKFNVDKEITRGGYGGIGAIITITLKPEFID
jgi:hypothetical protein